MKSMNMKKRMNKMSGLQQSIVETQQQKNHIQDKTTHKKTKDKNKTQEPIKKNNYTFAKESPKGRGSIYF